MSLPLDKIIIGWDPGVTTGLVVAKYIGGRNFDLLRVELVSWEHRYAKTRMITAAYASSNPAVLIESFKLREDKAREQVGSDFPSCQVIGIIGCWCYEFGIPDSSIIMQEPGIKSRVAILDRHFEALDKPYSSKDAEHVKDAYQHIRYYITQQVSRSR